MRGAIRSRGRRRFLDEWDRVGHEDKLNPWSSNPAEQTLRDAQVRERFGVSVVAIVKPGGGVILDPPPDTMLRPGDRLRVFGLSDQIDAFIAEIQNQQ